MRMTFPSVPITLDHRGAALRRLRIHPIATLAVVAVLGASLQSALLEQATARNDRPTISSFYARDEGSVIHLKVNFCQHGARNDSFSTTFRIWDDYTGRLVFQRRVSGRIHARCGWASMKIPDTFPNGRYRANPAVTNRTQRSFTRLRARPLWVS